MLVDEYNKAILMERQLIAWDQEEDKQHGRTWEEQWHSRITSLRTIETEI